MEIAILYNLSDEEKIEHYEILDVAQAVSKSLIKHGHTTKFVKFSDDFISECKNCDMVFNLAEDVKNDMISESIVPKMLDEAKIPYTGSDEKSTALCLDKVKMKYALIQAKITTPQFEPIKSETTTLTFPVIIKPSQLHASIGLSIDNVVHNNESFKKQCLHLQEYRPLMAEKYIEGRDIFASILAGELLPLTGIQYHYPKGTPNILSYDAKWDEQSPLYKKSISVCPIIVSKQIKKEIESVAKQAYRIANCRDYARMDFRLSDDNILYLLEINTNPCLNPVGTSYIKAANAAGLSYDKTIMTILESAQKRISKNRT